MAGSFFLGLIAGVVITGVLVWKLMPKLMLTVHKSRLGFEETVAAIEQAAKAHGWNVPKIYDLQNTIRTAGHEDMTPVKIISMCQPDHAYRVLREDANKMVSGIMPCRIGVFVPADGQVRLAKMNVRLMSRMFGGTITEVMAKVATEEERILRDVVEHR
ncbi:uncharacterized protein (DUF302 family) [Geothermobacter ehrlichii]|uniref:Uncharacterized protein (DUF302 family) n=1 Tax=Geothermobacter ehrlichii TaxID=213224 RepID=A0A5D3WLP5_9BACT|nr:DUF302 domain-containing protein [Geothermobacter ehrlichii]TYO99357.1 uncharacterized protein (DUF302 family) [Geothermobacter ehrlichii]